MGGLKPVRVLIVDDHPIIVSGCRALLQHEPGIEVNEAQDGAAGFTAYFNQTPDVGSSISICQAIRGSSFCAASSSVSRRPVSSSSA